MDSLLTDLALELSLVVSQCAVLHVDRTSPCC